MTAVPFLISAAIFALSILALEVVLGLEASFALLSVAHLGVGLYLFKQRGGNLVTPTGIYFLSVAIMLGIAGAQLLITQPEDVTEWTFAASWAAFASNLVILGVQRRRRQPFVENPKVRLDRRLAGWYLRVGTALFATGLLINLADPGLVGPLPDAFAFTGVVLLLAGVFLGPTPYRPSRQLVRMALAIVAIGLFVEIFFSGFGRLVVAGLVLVAFLLINLGEPAAWHKQVLVVALIPVLILAGWARVTVLGGETTPIDVIVKGEGLGSLTNPVYYLGELIDADRSGSPRAMDTRFGATYLEALVAWVPRDLWEEKPFGLGFELAARLDSENPIAGDPENAYSIAALTYGEWYVNFGWLGFVIIPPFLALALSGLDRWQARVVARRWSNESSHTLQMLMMVVIISGIPEFVWMGSFTMVSRTGIRLLIMAGIWILVDHARHIRETARRP
jgi:hypothetical protein